MNQFTNGWFELSWNVCDRLKTLLALCTESVANFFRAIIRIFAAVRN